MSEVHNEEVVRALIAALNRGDLDAYFALCAEDAEYHLPTPAKGHEAMRAVDEQFLAAFPDHHHLIEQLIAKDDVVVVRLRITGTQHGQLLHIAPTRRRIDLPVCNVIELRDGKVVGMHAYLDNFTTLRQLGRV